MEAHALNALGSIGAEKPREPTTSGQVSRAPAMSPCLSQLRHHPASSSPINGSSIVITPLATLGRRKSRFRPTIRLRPRHGPKVPSNTLILVQGAEADWRRSLTPMPLRASRSAAARRWRSARPTSLYASGHHPCESCSGDRSQRAIGFRRRESGLRRWFSVASNARTAKRRGRSAQSTLGVRSRGAS